MRFCLFFYRYQVLKVIFIWLDNVTRWLSKNFMRKINWILCFSKFLGVEIIKLVQLLTERFCTMTGIMWRQHEQLRIQVIIILNCPKCIRFWKYFVLTCVIITLGDYPGLASVFCQRSPSYSWSDLGMHLCLWAFTFCRNFWVTQATDDTEAVVCSSDCFKKIWVV
jgi:hypothetical protein